MSNEITPTTGTEQVTDRPIVRPAVDIFENQDELIVMADLPGVLGDDLAVDYDDGKLTILGRRGCPVPDDTKLVSGARAEWDYKRVFSVPDTIDADRIAAEFDMGVLTLHLPRHERTKPRRIAIQTS
ncbi:MAG: heat-shock protein [Proteobacteria bacterium]|nr:MAG: heat-shock protein [Pseudomonadota bacterium]